MVENEVTDALHIDRRAKNINDFIDMLGISNNVKNLYGAAFLHPTTLLTCVLSFTASQFIFTF